MSTKPATSGVNLKVLVGLWAIIAIAVTIRTLTNLEVIPLFNDTDDAMRLVMVRDFLAGQGWYDLTQYRLNTPFGASIHWSRLVDVPIAGLIMILTPLAGDNAQIITAYVWPLALLLLLMWLSAKLAMRLAGPDAILPGLVLPVLSVTLLPGFSPGRFDHHNVQILITIAVVLATINGWRSPVAGLLAGVLLATSLAVGTETLPIVAGAIVSFGLYWVTDKTRADTLRLFGVGFALASLAYLAIALPPQQWLQPACDAHSIVYALAALATAVVFALLPLLPSKTQNWPLRLGAGIVAGGLVLALLAMAYPQCLGGPYAALDPWLRDNWIANVTEARPIWVALQRSTASTIAISVPPIVALIVIGWRVWRGDSQNRVEWLVLGLFLLLSVLVMIFQIRGARLAAPLAVPAGGLLILSARARYLANQRLPNIAGLIGAWLLFTGFAIAIPIALLQDALAPGVTSTASDAAPVSPGDESICQQPATFTQLATLDPERIMAPFDLGPYLLLFTPHQTVGAPYHRNKDGMIDTVRFFNNPIAEARLIIAARGIERVVTCANLPEMKGYPDASPDSFLNLQQRGGLPDWLVEVTPEGSALRQYEVALN